MTTDNLLIILMGASWVICYDAVGAVASRKLNFHYGVMAVGSLIIYAFIGSAGAKNGTVLTGVLMSGIVAFVDATLGWWISIRLRANMRNSKNSPSNFLEWFGGAIVAIAIACLGGYVGARIVA